MLEQIAIVRFAIQIFSSTVRPHASTCCDTLQYCHAPARSLQYPKSTNDETECNIQIKHRREQQRFLIYCCTQQSMGYYTSEINIRSEMHTHI